MRFLSLALALMLTLLAAACGGSGLPRGTGHVQFVEPPQQGGQLPPVPVSESFLPQRQVSSVTATVVGANGEKYLNETINATAVDLAAPPSGVAYALLRFGGIPGEAIEQLDYSGSGLSAGGQVWVGLADYSTERWKFLAPGASASGTFATASAPGQFTSAGGDIYVLVVVYGGTAYTLDSVSLTYPARFSISGHVEDTAGNPVEDATVSTPLFNLQAQTDASGNYSLPGIPEGTWPVVATKNGWTFYDNPGSITVAGGDATAGTFVGHVTQSNFLPGDPDGQDGGSSVARSIDFDAGPVSSTLSIVDDTLDYYNFSVAAPGVYFVEFTNPDGDVLFPYMEVLSETGTSLVASSFALRGRIRVPVLVGQAPQQFTLHCGLAGGGGGYQLELGEGVCHELRGVVKHDPMASLGAALVHAQPATGDATDYLATGGTGQYIDKYRPAEQTEVSVTLAGYTAGSTSVNLASGDAMADFTPTPGTFTDTMEPNNNPGDADAKGALSLPYDSAADGDKMTINRYKPVGPEVADLLDYYLVEPGIGLGLVANLILPGGDPDVPAFTFRLVDEAGDNVGTTAATPTGFQARLDQISGAGKYYIVVQGNGSLRKYKYDLTVETFDPHVLYFEVLMGVKPLPGATVELRDEDFTWRQSFVTSDSGTTRGIFLPEGAVVYAELMRYGISNHRETRRFVVPNTDTKLTFTADPLKSVDTKEPDNDLNTAQSLTLPSTTTASLDSVTDPADYYRCLATGKSLKVTLDFADSRTQVNVSVFDQIGAQIGFPIVARDEVPVYLPLGASGLYRLKIEAPGFATAYGLAVENATAFQVSGKVTDGVTGIGTARVYCVETDQYVAAQAFSGTYNFGFLPPGSYTLKAFAPGYAVPADHTATVSNAAVTDDFALTPSIFDADEPNDTQGTAVAVPTDGSVSTLRSINLGVDSADYYKFPVTAGQLYEVTVDWQEPWHYPPSVLILDTTGSQVTSFNGGYTQRARFSLLAKATGNHYAQIISGPAEYTISVKVITP